MKALNIKKSDLAIASSKATGELFPSKYIQFHRPQIYNILTLFLWYLLPSLFLHHRIGRS